MKMHLTIAIRNLLRSGRRTLLLSAAIAGVTFFLVLLLSLTEGIRQNVVQSATTLLSGHVNVTGFYKSSTSQADPITLEAPKVRRLIEEKVDGVTSVVDRTQGIAQVISHTESIPSLLMGIDITEETDFTEVVQLAAQSEYVEGGDPEVVEGDVGRLTEPKTALLFASQAERLGVGVGDPLTIRAQTFQGVANTADVTVVAIVRDVGLLSNFALFLPKQTIRDLYELREDATGLVMAYLENPNGGKDAMGTRRKALEEADYEVLERDPQPTFAKFETMSNSDWTGYKIDLTTWEDQISFITWILTAVNTVSFFIVLVLCVLIGVGMINTMVMSVRDRTSEIGTMRAMGMNRGGVLGLFMLEALILGVAAASIGGGLGVAAALGIDALEWHIPVEAVQAILMSDVLNMAPQPTHVGLAVGGIALFVGLAALWPSWQASRLTPVDAMRQSD